MGKTIWLIFLNKSVDLGAPVPMWFGPVPVKINYLFFKELALDITGALVTIILVFYSNGGTSASDFG